MAQLETRPPARTIRGTWDEVLAHKDEIANSSEVELRVFEPKLDKSDDPTIALLESWLAEAPKDPDDIREAEEDLLQFKRNMNLPRKETGARLHYPEAE